MTVETRHDGTLIVSERLPLLRWGSLIGGVLIAATLAMIQDEPQRLRLGAFLAAGFASLMAFALAALTPDRWFAFDPASRRLTWAVTRLLGAKQGSLSFNEITSVVLQPDFDPEATHARPMFRPVLVTMSGHLPLTSVSGFDRDAGEKLCGDLRGIIALANRDGTPEGTIRELARDGFVVDAVSLARREYGFDLAEAEAYVHALREKAA